MLSSRVLFTSLLFCVPALASPRGKIGFVGAKGAQIVNLQTGAVRSLPRGSKATLLTISPNGTAIYFVPAVGAKPLPDGMGVPSNALNSLLPYSSAKPLAALSVQIPNSQQWNPSGTTLYVSTNKLSGAFTPATGHFTPLKTLPGSVDARSRKFAYSTANQIIVRDTVSGQSRVLFDIRKPAPMLAALKRAKSPKGVKDLLSAVDDSMIKDEDNWQLSDPAITPDGTRLYFTSNAGTGAGAAGNATFVVFAVDLRTGSLSALSKVGTEFGRSPHIMTVSSDGQRLLMATSAHNSAADNSCFVEVIDLPTQNSREVFMGTLPGAKGKANFLDSAVWSPDGKYVAMSGYFYDADKSWPKDGVGWPEVKTAQYTMGIVDAATGRLVKTIKGATSLSWVR